MIVQAHAETYPAPALSAIILDLNKEFCMTSQQLPEVALGRLTACPTQIGISFAAETAANRNG